MLFRQFKDEKTGKPIFKYTRPNKNEIKDILSRAEMCKPRTWKYTRKKKTVAEEDAYPSQKQYVSNQSDGSEKLRKEFAEEERINEDIAPDDLAEREDDLRAREAELDRREQEHEDFLAERDKYMDDLETEKKEVDDERARVAQMSAEVVAARKQMMDHLAEEKARLRELRGLPPDGPEGDLSRIEEDQAPQSSFRGGGSDPLDGDEPRPEEPPIEMGGGGIGRADWPPTEPPADYPVSGTMASPEEDGNTRDPSPVRDGSYMGGGSFKYTPSADERNTEFPESQAFPGPDDREEVMNDIRRKTSQLRNISEKIDDEEDDLKNKREEYEALEAELKKEENRLRMLREAVADKIENLNQQITDRDSQHPSGTSPSERLRLRGAAGVSAGSAREDRGGYSSINFD